MWRRWAGAWLVLSLGCASGGGAEDGGGRLPDVGSSGEDSGLIERDTGPTGDDGGPEIEDVGPIGMDTGPLVPADAGPCAGAEVCNGADDNCDGVVDETGCPDRCSGVVYLGRDYVFCNRNQDWMPAQSECVALRMRLVRVDDAGEQTFLRSTANGRAIGAIWLGAGDGLLEGQWMWTDGEPFWMGGSGGMAVDGRYSNWSDGEPNDDGTEDCATMTDDGTWNDDECGSGRPFVCERY